MSRSGMAEEPKLFTLHLIPVCLLFTLVALIPATLTLSQPQGRLCLLFSLSSLKKTFFTRFSSRDPLASKKQTPICRFPIFKFSKTPQVDILCPSEKNHSRFFPVSCWRHLAKAVKQFSLVSFGLLSGRLSLIITIRLVKERVTPAEARLLGRKPGMDAAQRLSLDATLSRATLGSETQETLGRNGLFS